MVANARWRGKEQQMPSRGHRAPETREHCKIARFRDALVRLFYRSTAAARVDPPRRRRAAARFRGGLVLQSRLSPPHPSRRGTIRRNSARDGGERRLDYAAPEQHQVFREARLAVLDHRGRLYDLRRASVDRTLLACALGISGSSVHRLRRPASGRPPSGPLQRGGARQQRRVRPECADSHPRCGRDLLDEPRIGKPVHRPARRCDAR